MMIGHDRRMEKTGFQEHHPYIPEIDLQTDFVMVYGTDSDVEKRIRDWKKRGYVVHLMTGVAWGQYQDYLNGKIDGRNHWDESQKYKNDKYILHGDSVDIPYMVPTISFSEYLTGQIKKAVDAGVEAIHLEEPEFWVDGGYSDAFKREWEIYYKEPWIPPHTSADAQYRASKLKIYLYTRMLDRLCSALKEYAKVKYGRDLRFYVPTHSLINYTQWRIVSPESRLMDLPAVDGYIAQIWTGTSRTPNMYEGIRRERTFDTAFLEYGIMQELVRGTGKDMWFLHDPIEDNPRYTWGNYRMNYFKTLVASLLHPGISDYEVCPWPNRVFMGSYPSKDGKSKEKIPSGYATTLLVLMHTLSNMDQAKSEWLNKNPEIGILLSDSAMFQRLNIKKTQKKVSKYDGTTNDTANADDIDLLNWSSFYGLTLPLLKYGIPVRPVQLDNIRRFADYLDGHRILILSYEFMKPEYPDIHNALAEWIKSGGILVYAGDGSDKYHDVREWWNQGRIKYATPACHLFKACGLEEQLEQGIHNVGKGLLTVINVHPAEFTLSKKKADILRKYVMDSAKKKKDNTFSFGLSNHFVMKRGPYVIAAVLDEGISDKPLTLTGKFVNLFDPGLPVVNRVTVRPDNQILLYDLSTVRNGVELIAAASRIESMYKDKKGFSFTAIGPKNVKSSVRFYSRKTIIKAEARNAKTGKRIDVEHVYCTSSSTVLFRFDNLPEGVIVKAEYK